METFVLIFIVASAFGLGRLTNFGFQKKTKNIKHELDVMTASRDRWRQQYLARVMKNRLDELNCKNSENS